MDSSGEQATDGGIERDVAALHISAPELTQQHAQAVPSEFEDEGEDQQDVNAEDDDADGDGDGDGNHPRCVLEDYTRLRQRTLWLPEGSGRCTGRRGAGPQRTLLHYRARGWIGKFSFFMLKALEEMRETCPFPAGRFIYVMTDFTEQNFKFWVDHPSLRPFLDSGQLEMAIFDAVNDTTIRLSRSGVVLAPGTVKNPLCIVANYLFDTLCHDIFQVEQGVLKEGLISVGSKRAEEPDPLDPEIIQRFDNRFEYRAIDENYYCDEDGDEVHFRRILHWYVDSFGESSSGVSILFPIGALRALRRLCSFSGGRALVISGDKGNNNPEQFRGLTDPHIAVHGSFSVMVNYHAIGAYFTSHGGFALHNPQEEASLEVSAFVMGGRPARGPKAVVLSNARKDATSGAAESAVEDTSGGGGGGGAAAGDAAGAAQGEESYEYDSDDDGLWTGDAIDTKDARRARRFPHLSAAFCANVERFGPNDFFIMQKCVKEDAPTPTLKSVVALLKLGDWDPDVFYKFRDAILNQVPTATLKLKKDLSRGMPRIWENYYMLDKDKDVAFELGRFYYGIREYAAALKFYHDSSVNVGQHHVTQHNIGLCRYSMGEPREAVECFKESLVLNPDYEKARSWLDKVQQELDGRPAVAIPGEPLRTAATAAAAGLLPMVPMEGVAMAGDNGAVPVAYPLAVAMAVPAGDDAGQASGEASPGTPRD